MDSLVVLYCLVDDFCKVFEPAWSQRLITNGERKRQRAAGLALSELMTPIVLFHQTRYRQFKAFYLTYVHAFLRREFPHLPIYPSTHLPIYPSTHLPSYPSTQLPIYPATHLPSYQRCIALLPLRSGAAGVIRGVQRTMHGRFVRRLHILDGLR